MTRIGTKRGPVSPTSAIPVTGSKRTKLVRVGRRHLDATFPAAGTGKVTFEVMQPDQRSL